MDLDEDITAALRVLGVKASDAKPITGLPSPVSDRATVRIVLGDGRIVKARRFSRPAKAKRYASLVRSLGHLPVPAILSLAGRVTVEEWVEGRPLCDLASSRKRLHRAADILAAVHATEKLGRRRLPASASTRSLVVGAKERIEKLVAAGALSGSEAGALLVAIRRGAPTTARTGLTHNDFCAENIVEDTRGRLYVVDNGGLQLGFLDFDLARSWYRWPMPEAAWQAFLSRYRTWRRPPLAAAETLFWRIAAVVKSAQFRVSRRSAGVEIPLRGLRRLIGDLRAGE